MNLDSPTSGSWEGGVSYERGTPVAYMYFRWVICTGFPALHTVEFAVSFVRIFERYVTKSALHQDLT